MEKNKDKYNRYFSKPNMLNLKVCSLVYVLPVKWEWIIKAVAFSKMYFVNKI